MKIKNPQSAIRNPQSGMTLIELLVVVIIITTLVAAAIPIMSPANDDRRLREAARSVNTFITGAQTRAIANNRPYGVMLKRLSQDTGRDEDNGVCLEMFYVEQPAPYSGFDPNSRVCVALHPDPTQIGFVLVRFVTRGTPTAPGLPAGWVHDLFPEQMMRPGDVVEINGTRYELSSTGVRQRGDQYTTVSVDPNTGYYRSFNQGAIQILARPINDSGQQVNPAHDNRGSDLRDAPLNPPAQRPYWTKPAPYKILRQPVPTPDQPYQLPEGAAIDLRASGVGTDRDRFFYWPALRDNRDGVLVMFTPEGRVERIRYNQKSRTTDSDNYYNDPVVDNVYLLVGKRENVPAPPLANDPTLDPSRWSQEGATEEARARLRQPINWLRGESRWVVVGSQSGRIVTIENAFVDPFVVGDNPPYPFNAANAGTEDLRAAQILAAREFTRDMRQLGGR